MRENLKQFVRQQAIRGESPDKLKEGLILNGWNAKEVDDVIKETYGLKKKINKTIIFLVILLIIVFSLSLFLIFNNLYYEQEQIPNTPPTQNRDLITTQNETQETKHECQLINNIEEKEDCYFTHIKEGFDCDNLNTQEEFHCNRVLENYMLTLFEIEE
ncbi:MAG: hypothetical protein ACLFN8_03315 [Candidatus Woesearchaeota archaeon]